ncbi:hypothetical protein BLNAU_2182 [Blattamonas nauphoetae]|uniref:Uncharacterized protein n=1 Tax=Blattamonas nauphoetae TaxID=2049346 RepID=A0ABQ9YGP0_9EUKA|nr:hypothetical protein BLNAU_2182 [Blattamonas nauphoetae]
MKRQRECDKTHQHCNQSSWISSRSTHRSQAPLSPPLSHHHSQHTQAQHHKPHTPRSILEQLQWEHLISVSLLLSNLSLGRATQARGCCHSHCQPNSKRSTCLERLHLDTRRMLFSTRLVPHRILERVSRNLDSSLSNRQRSLAQFSHTLI